MESTGHESVQFGWPSPRTVRGYRRDRLRHDRLPHCRSMKSLTRFVSEGWLPCFALLWMCWSFRSVRSATHLWVRLDWLKSSAYQGALVVRLAVDFAACR